MSPEVIAEALAALGGSGLGGTIMTTLTWWRGRRKEPLDVAALAQDVAALALKHARAEVEAAYGEATSLRSELAAARTEIDHLSTDLAAARGEITRLTALLQRPAT